MPKLFIHNTLTKKKEEFTPVDSNHVRMYTCGPTVYNYAHIGNARPAVISDLLVRVLRQLYKKVTYVSNITDIDDKIIKRSLEEKKTCEEISETYLRIYNSALTSSQISEIYSNGNDNKGSLIITPLKTPSVTSVFEPAPRI